MQLADPADSPPDPSPEESDLLRRLSRLLADIAMNPDPAEEPEPDSVPA